MRRKNDEQQHDLEGVAQRLRDERPTASPLELDQIKTSAMSRARAGKMRTAPRRLAAAGLTVGLMVAGTGGVIAAGQNGSSGNAAQAQYSSSQCDVGNVGGDNSNNYNCNNNSFNTINNYYSSTTTTVTLTAAGANAVQGFQTARARTSSRHIHLHLTLKKGSKLKKVTITLNGKRFSVLTGKHASSNVDLVNLPCSTSGSSTVTITATLAGGKTVKQTHTYHLCTA